MVGSTSTMKRSDHNKRPTYLSHRCSNVTQWKCVPIVVAHLTNECIHITYQQWQRQHRTTHIIISIPVKILATQRSRFASSWYLHSLRPIFLFQLRTHERYLGVFINLCLVIVSPLISMLRQTNANMRHFFHVFLSLLFSDHVKWGREDSIYDKDSQR